MPKVNVVIEGFDFTIEYPVYIKGMYKVYWEEVWIGYIYYRMDRPVNHKKIWYDTSDYAKLYLVKLSNFIECNKI
jgi:hypothetical protein